MKRNVTNNMPIRLLVTKPGLDGHDKGAKMVALVLIFSLG